MPLKTLALSAGLKKATISKTKTSAIAKSVVQTRYWLLPGGITAKDEPTEPIGWNLFWYCSKCSEVYARAWVEGQPWKAIGGLCPNCPDTNRWMIPGTLETLSLVGWKVPDAVIRHQFECELKFTRSKDHPWNKENENEDVNSLL